MTTPEPFVPPKDHAPLDQSPDQGPVAEATATVAEAAEKAPTREEPTAEKQVPALTELAEPRTESTAFDLVRNEVIPALKTFSARADFYEKLVRQLQQRIELLQTDQVQELLSPVFQRLAVLLSQATDSADRARCHEGDYQADIEFDHFADLVVEALSLVNVDSVDAVAGMPFNRRLHAARKAVATRDKTLDGTIARVLRQGLIREGSERAFLPAQVTVFRYSADAPSPAPSLPTTVPAQAGPLSPPVTTSTITLNSQSEPEGELS